MRLYLLGPLELRDVRGEHVELAGLKQRSLLATLAVRAGQVVSAERLVAEVWGERPPANAANALQAHIRRLRKVVESACGEPDRIVTRPPGYLLHLRPGETDAAEFVALVTTAKALAATDPAGAIPVLRSALSLWQGEAMDGCTTGDICAAEALVLEENRLAALETLYDASLRTGRHAEVVGELEETSAAHPLRERFYDQLMAALHGADRQSDALRVYDRARQRLLREVGVEPGPALRARMQSIMALADRPAELVDLSRELVELQQRIDSLAERQEVLLRTLRRQS
jgi:SARP family transcriptional regulator, regulator of embCAB operon